MRRAFLYIILFLPVIFAQAQTSELDELTMPVLRQKLAASKEDTTRVKLQLALGHLMFSKSIKGQKDIDSAIMFAAQAQSLSSRLNFQFGIINSMLLKSEISYNKGDGAGGKGREECACFFASA